MQTVTVRINLCAVSHDLDINTSVPGRAPSALENIHKSQRLKTFWMEYGTKTAPLRGGFSSKVIKSDRVKSPRSSQRSNPKINMQSHIDISCHLGSYLLQVITLENVEKFNRGEWFCSALSISLETSITCLYLPLRLFICPTSHS